MFWPRAVRLAADQSPQHAAGRVMQALRQPAPFPSSCSTPITWPKPFCLVMTEALAAATLVLVFSRGAAPEIIDHGRTGYLCCGEEEMIAAVARVPEFDRWRCWAAAEGRFSLARIAADSERLYLMLLDHPGQLISTRPGAGVR
jgi:glycosyltransferase involved in cell wall biosynthesis